MDNKLEKIVVRLKGNHPSGQRKRAGFRFDEDAQMIEVNAKQKKLIEEDTCLFVITKGTAYKEAKKVYDGKRSDDNVVAKNEILKAISECKTLKELEEIVIDAEGDADLVKAFAVKKEKLEELEEKIPVDPNSNLIQEAIKKINECKTLEELNGFDYENEELKNLIDVKRAEFESVQNDSNEDKTDGPEGNVNPEIALYGKLISRMNKEELTVALTKAGQVQGKDFTVEATNKDLAELLKNL